MSLMVGRPPSGISKSPSAGRANSSVPSDYLPAVMMSVLSVPLIL
jgi:hypothetical protein